MKAKLLVISGLIGSTLLFGCNQTTRKDVTAAHDKVANEQRKLDEVKREEMRTVNKPVVDSSTQRNEADKVADQEQRVRDAKREEAKVQQDLNNEQQRDQFLIDCKTSIDLANRSIEKLQTSRNAATEEQKQEIDRQIGDIKSKRDALQSEINNIRTSDKSRWNDYRAAAQSAMDDLNRVSGKSS